MLLLYFLIWTDSIAIDWTTSIFLPPEITSFYSAIQSTSTAAAAHIGVNRIAKCIAYQVPRQAEQQ